jgi:hypothetical protein
VGTSGAGATLAWPAASTDSIPPVITAPVDTAAASIAVRSDFLIAAS